MSIYTTVCRSLNVRASEPNILSDVLLIQCKRLPEHPGKLPHFPLERLLVRPCQARVQQLPRHTFNKSRYRQSKRAKTLKVGLGELSGMDSIDDSARVFEWAALARAELAARPARVDEPAVDLMFGHAFGEHFGVAAWVEDDERCAITGGEGRDGF